MPNFIELCSGAGGLSTGLIQAGFEPILLNELVPVFCETLRKNHPGVNVVNMSMTDLNLEKYNGQIDLLCGGIPCQSFSHAGKRLGLEDERGNLMLEFVRLRNECNPKMFLIENVKGLLTHDEGKTIEYIVNELWDNGKYYVYTHLLNAHNYNVPQKRERVIIVGHRYNMLKTFEVPKPDPRRPVLRDVLLDVPPSPGIKYPKSKEEVLKLVPPGGCWVDLPDDIKKEYMGKSYFLSGGKTGMARRLSLDEPSLTLTTSPCQKQTERCHPTETRPFTIREYARIQTFPDDYVFCGSVLQQYRQIGNAVPVKLAKAIGESIKTVLEPNCSNETVHNEHNILSVEYWKHTNSFKNIQEKETQLKYYRNMGSTDEIMQLVELESKPFGSEMEKILKEILKMDNRTSAQNDATKYNKKIEIKSARYWSGKDDCIWQHIEPDHDYEYVLFSLLDFNDIKIWCMKKEYLFGDMKNKKILTFQGKQGYWVKKSEIIQFLTPIRNIQEFDYFISS